MQFLLSDTLHDFFTDLSQDIGPLSHTYTLNAVALPSASCECAATSSDTIESRADLSDTASPRRQRASPGMASEHGENRMWVCENENESMFVGWVPVGWFAYPDQSDPDRE